MKGVLLVMLASVLAWAEALPADFEFLVLLPFGVGALGLACDAAIGGRRRRAHRPSPGDSGRDVEERATPRGRVSRSRA